MISSRPKVKRAARSRCSGCRKLIAGYQSVSYSSAAMPERLLCWQCYNTEVAQADGLASFQHFDFEPMRLVDCEGTPRQFHFRMRLLGPTVALDAFEHRFGAPAGYRFQIIGDAEEDPLALFGRLVEKIRRGLAVKTLQMGELGLAFAGTVARGRFEWDAAAHTRVPLVVIDGREIAWEQFGQMLMSFEGWQFRLRLLDPSDEA